MSDLPAGLSTNSEGKYEYIITYTETLSKYNNTI